MPNRKYPRTDRPDPRPTGQPAPAEPRASGGPAPWDCGEDLMPFCGDEYPPLKGSPGAVICTKPSHPHTEMHLNDETGWVWPND